MSENAGQGVQICRPKRAEKVKITARSQFSARLLVWYTAALDTVRASGRERVRRYCMQISVSPSRNNLTRKMEFTA